MSKKGRYLGGHTVLTGRDFSWFSKNKKKKKGRKQQVQPQQKQISTKRIGIAELAYRQGLKGTSSYLIKAEAVARGRRKPDRSKQKYRAGIILPEPSLAHGDQKSTVQSLRGKRRLVVVERAKTRRPSPQS